MPKRVLTEKQTEIIKGITAELSDRVKDKITISEFLQGCLCTSILDTLQERIIKARQTVKTGSIEE